MFGQQDDTQQASGAAWSDQPAPDTTFVTPSDPSANSDNPYLGGTAPQAQPASPPPLLEAQAADGTPAGNQPSAPAVGAPANDLLDIKQQALQQLSPLVGHLEQTPEEKFRTTMMMIQASDNQSLISAAYEAANQITDEKAKAQALLDIVNEINYFTQH